MRTFLNNSVMGFRADGASHQSAVWRAKPPNHLANQIGSVRTTTSIRSGSAESQPIPEEPENRELPDNDFPFSALIRLVRQMRQ
jgi:hypothetical protein